MDKHKKLSEELLKMDGIDPANISKTEREMFRQMLNKEIKNYNQLSRRSLIKIGILVLVMLGLCMSEGIFDRLHIPFVAGWTVVIMVTYVALRLIRPNDYKQIKESGKKVHKLHFLVHGKYKGFPLVGKKDGKRYIDWLNITLLAAAMWFVMSLCGAGIYYLFSRRWILSGPASLFYIPIGIIASLAFVISLLHLGLKAPLTELEEIETKNYTCSRRKFSFVTITVIITACAIGIHFLGGSSVALADVVKKIEQTTNCVFKKITTSSSEDNNTDVFDSLVYYTQGAMREDMYRDNKLTSQVYVIFPEGIFVGIDHQKRLLYKRNLTDEDMKEFSPISPGNIVNLILSKGKYKKLGRKKIDGIISEGFVFNDKRAMLSMDKDNIEDVTMCLWVDVTTDLPICIEIDGIYKNTTKANVIMFEPQWNVELDADFFKPIMPSDYILAEN